MRVLVAVLFLGACEPVARGVKVLGWTNGGSNVPVVGPLVLTCSPTCTGAPKGAVAHSSGGDVAVTFVVANGEWVGTPKVRLSYGTAYTLALPPTIPSPPLDFTTEPDPTTAPKVALWPDPAAPAPANLAWLVLHFTPAVELAGVQDLALADGEKIVRPTRVEATGGERVTSVILWGPFGDARCSTEGTARLCSGETYTLHSTTGLHATQGAGISDLANYLIGDADTDGPQWQGDGEVVANDVAVTLERGVDRPCLLEEADNPETSPLTFPTDFSSGSLLLSGLTPATSYSWSMVCVDATLSLTPVWSVNFQTQFTTLVHLVEVVSHPLQNWYDASGANGAPFDGTPGPNLHAAADDEYAELINLGAEPADISAWHLVTVDTDPSDEAIGELWTKKPLHAFGSLPLQPNARVVLALTTSRKKASPNIAVELFDQLGVLRDSVALGQNGSPLGDGIDFDHESVSLCPDADPTAQGQWVQTYATPGAPNACP